MNSYTRQIYVYLTPSMSLAASKDIDEQSIRKHQRPFLSSGDVDRVKKINKSMFILTTRTSTSFRSSRDVDGVVIEKKD